MKVLYHLAVIIAVLGFTFVFTDAQANTGNTTNLNQLTECKQLGIKPEKCSEQAILSKRCLGSNEACNHSTEVKIDTNLIPIYVGIATAFVVGVIYVKRTNNDRKENANQI